MSSFHCCFDLGYVLKHAREMAAAGVTMRGERMTEASLTAHAAILRARGFEVLPTCSEYDARGYCRGHESAEGAHSPEGPTVIDGAGATRPDDKGEVS
jgi:hypothetical protein